MNYYLDCEFLEGTQTKRILGIPYGKTKPTIDLISMALVAEDGREGYWISKDFNLKEAWNRFDLKRNPPSNINYDPAWQPLKKVYWIRENVLRPIFDYLRNKCQEEINETLRMFRRSKTVPNKIYKLLYLQPPTNKFTLKNLRKLIKKYGKSNAQIAEEVKEFVGKYKGMITKESSTPKPMENIFYAYYADYDWVVFCWLFGRMIDLPKGFPYYCRDLKQMLDEKVNIFCAAEIKGTSFDSALNRLKNKHPGYPKQTNEHSAIHDARWNRDLHKFIQSL